MCLWLNIILEITTFPRRAIPPQLMVFLYADRNDEIAAALLLALTVSEHSPIHSHTLN